MSIFYLACAIVFTVIAQVSYKLFFLKKEKLYLVVALVVFCCIPFMSYLALKGLNLSTVYMSTGLTYVLVMLSARYILKEAVQKQHMYAVVLIVSGVLVFNI